MDLEIKLKYLKPGGTHEYKETNTLFQEKIPQRSPVSQTHQPHLPGSRRGVKTGSQQTQ